MPGPKGGINDDGFYELLLVFPDNLNNNINMPDYKILVVDCESGTEFGPFEDGTSIKYTEANGAKASIKSMTGENSKADAVDFHIKGKGDMCLKLVIINDGNNGYNVIEGCGCCCPVPPPPK